MTASHHEHRTLCARTADGQELTAACGYAGGKAVAALFVGESNRPILLPRDFLQAVIDQGWRLRPCSPGGTEKSVQPLLREWEAR